MKRRIQFGAALLGLAALLAIGCTLGDSPTIITVTQDQGQGNGTPQASPSPGAPAGCAAVDEVAVTARIGGTGGQVVTQFSVGETVTLDATPKGGVPRDALDASCHGASVLWSASRPDCRFLGATSGFNPELQCASSGPVTVTAIVSAPGGQGSVGLTVTP